MPKTNEGIGKRFIAAVKGAALAWGGAQSTQTSLQSEISATLVGGIPVSRVRLSMDTFYTIWRNHGDVYGAVRELAQAVGVAGYYWENKAGSDKDPNPKSVKQAEQVLTFYRPLRAWLREIITDVSVAGNAYYYRELSKGGGILSLQRLDPRMMTAVTDKYGTLLRWIQRGAQAETVIFQPEEVLHFVTAQDPNSPVFGISPLEPVLWDVRTDLAAMISNYALFMNDSTPASMYVFDEQMTDQEIARAVETLQEKLKGAENRHKSLGMKGLKEIKTISITNKDMEFMALRKLSTEKVCAAFGVPKSILGYTEDVNLANGEEQTKKFWESTVQPLEEVLAEFINRVFLPSIGIDDIKFCFENRSFDNREWNEASTRADMQLGIMTVNEVREERGKEPFDEAKFGEMVNRPIIFAGTSARPLEDVGVDTTGDIAQAIADETATEKSLQRLDHLGRAYEQRKQQAKNAKR